MSRPSIAPMVALALLVWGSSARAAVVVVEPAELTKRTDLIGREISVDDRVQRFHKHQGGGIEAITLARTPVLFRIPKPLGFTLTPDARAVRLQGVLRREGSQWVCDVTDLDLFPRDTERVDRAVAALPAGEFIQRNVWAEWAKRRGKEFKDKDLEERGRIIEGDAIRFEAEHEAGDPSAHWLELARRARAHGIPEPEPSALTHRAFRARLAQATSVKELRPLVAEIKSLLPGATVISAPNKEDAEAWDAPYAANPAAAYRAAPAPVRLALDHRLWADAIQRLFEQQVADDPQNASTIAEQAAKDLPDRPAVADRLLGTGLKVAAERVTSLRLSEVQSLARTYRDRLQQPERARELLREWLDDQRKNHLSPTDAEGRLALANQYENLLNDRTTAAALLQAAWKIDPESKELVEAFQRRGFRKVDDSWVEPTQTRPQPSPAAETEAAARVAMRNQSLRGRTPQEVRTLMGGPPNRVSLCATQGEWIEQWVYLGARNVQFVNFLHKNGEQVATVVAYYSLPRTLATPSQP